MVSSYIVYRLVFRLLIYILFRHLMTGIGAYFQLVWSIWLRYCLDGRQGEYDLNWPTTFSLPEIVYVQGLNSSVNNGLDGIIGDDRKKQN